MLLLPVSPLWTPFATLYTHQWLVLSKRSLLLQNISFSTLCVSTLVQLISTSHRHELWLRLIWLFLPHCHISWIISDHAAFLCLLCPFILFLPLISDKHVEKYVEWFGFWGVGFWGWGVGLVWFLVGCFFFQKRNAFYGFPFSCYLFAFFLLPWLLLHF